jgi:subtilase family serine protease
VKKPLRILAAAVAPVPILASVLLAGTAHASAEPLVAVPQNVNPAVAHSTRVGDVAGQQRMSLAVSLKLHDEAGLQRFLAQVSDKHSALYRHYLTPAEFTAKYGPTQADVAKVTAFLKAGGLTVSRVSGNRQVVDVTGSAAQVEKAFGTTISNYTQGAKHFYANDSAPAMPAAVASVVQGVAGLDNHAARHTFNTKKAGATSVKPHATAGGYGPSDLQGAYDTGSLGSGSGQSVALWEFDGYQTSNISAYDSQFGINASTPQTVSVDGANYDSSPGQGQGEVELDIEIVQAMANAANTFVYEAPNSDAGQIDMANQIATDKKVSVTSISWGLCEASTAAATITSTDNALQQGAAEGISFYSASGDSGSDDCGDGTTGVDYPASDPNVSGVGGTTLSASGGTYGGETAWSGSGGGTSNTFSTPSWQTGSGGKRTVPDVSSDADPNTGYAVYSAGAWQVYGGTSCAAPMWAGFTALYDAKAGKSLGNPNPALYGVTSGSAFHDITSGSNGAYNAGPGYDQVTGLGSYDGAALAGVL